MYENEIKNSQWKYSPEARQVVEKERNRPWTLPERIEYARGFDNLLALVTRPERQATTQEIEAIRSLQVQAHKEISINHNQLPAPQDSFSKTASHNSEEEKEFIYSIHTYKNLKKACEKDIILILYCNTN